MKLSRGMLLVLPVMVLVALGYVVNSPTAITRAQDTEDPPALPDIQGVWDMQWSVVPQQTTCTAGPAEQGTLGQNVVISQSGDQIELFAPGAASAPFPEPAIALVGQVSQPFDGTSGTFTAETTAMRVHDTVSITTDPEGAIVSGTRVMRDTSDVPCTVTLELTEATRIGDAPTHTVCAQGCDFPTVQEAVTAANPRDIIKVASGTYTDTNDLGGTPQIVYLDKSMIVRGGYTTDNWGVPAPGANPTVLDAQGAGRVFYMTGVLTNINVTLTGLTMTGGNAQGLGGYNDMGIGRVPDGVGGGLFAISTTLTLLNNQIVDNHAIAPDEQLQQRIAGFGGGLALISCNAHVRDTTIADNTAQDGGGGFAMASTTAWYSNTISRNLALNENPGKPLVNPPFGYGGGLTLLMNFGPVIVQDNTIANNSADLNGGGILVPYNFGPVFITGNTITGNTSAWIGGGGVIDAGPPQITGTDNPVLFSGNTLRANLGVHGGGFMLTRATSFLSNNIFAENQASAVGSGLLLQTAVGHLTNNTFARHTRGDGSGISVTNLNPDIYPPGDAPTGLFTSTALLTNTILVSNTVGITVENASNVVLDTTLWGSGAWANAQDTGGAGTIVAHNDVTGDPAFVSPDTGNYHIGAASDARNQGTPTMLAVDIDGESLALKSGVDIGADQYIATTGASRGIAVLRDLTGGWWSVLRLH